MRYVEHSSSAAILGRAALTEISNNPQIGDQKYWQEFCDKKKVAGFIYMATNKLNGRWYIGKTGRNWLRRIIEHQVSAKHPFGIDLKEYSRESFHITVLDIIPEEGGEEMLREAEIYFIAKWNKLLPGMTYNQSVGGEGGKR